MPVRKMSNLGLASTSVAYKSFLAGNAVYVPFTPTGSYESIATVTVGAGGQSTITFTSIPSTYTHLQLRGVSRGTTSYTSGTDTAYLTFNNDSTASYSYHFLGGSGSSAGSSAGTSQSIAYSMVLAQGNSGLANMFSGFIIDVFDYTDTNKNKVFKSVNGVSTNNAVTSSDYMYVISGNWMKTSAINRIDFAIAGSSFAQYSQIALYGVK